MKKKSSAINLVQALKGITNSPYIASSAISSWFEEATEEKILSCSLDELIEIMDLVSKIRIYDSSFVERFLKVIGPRLADISTEGLDRLAYNLIVLQHPADRDFIHNITQQITTRATGMEQEQCINFMWVMSKFNYRDESLMQSLTEQLRASSPKLKISSTIKLLQATAKLDFTSPVLTDFIISSTNLEKASQAGLILMAFYSTMIYVNNNRSEELKSYIEGCISKINFGRVTTSVDKLQLTQIHIAGFDIPLESINSWKKSVEKHVKENVTISYSQQKVMTEIRDKYDLFCSEIALEKWVPDLATSVDIFMRYRNTGVTLIVEVDGKSHVYFNDHTRLNATTKFHSALAEKKGFNLYRINLLHNTPQEIHMTQIDQILGVMNERILSAERSIISTAVAAAPDIGRTSAVAMDSESNKLGETKAIKKSQQKKKRSDKVAIDEDSFDLLMEQQRKINEEESRLKDYEKLLRETKGKYPQVLSRLINEGDSSKLKEFLQHCKEVKREEYEAFVNAPMETSKSDKKKATALDFAFEKFKSADTEGVLYDDSTSRSKLINAFNIVSLLTSHGARMKLREDNKAIIQLCMLSVIDKKDMDLFVYCLDSIPEGVNKNLFKELLFFEAASRGNKTIVSYFLDSEININVVHPRDHSQSMLMCIEDSIIFNDERIKFPGRYNFIARLSDRLFKELSIPLSEAFNNEIKRVKKLFASVDNLDSDSLNPATGITAIHSACYSDQYEIAKMLLQNGANINTVNAVGASPFYTAVFNSARIADLFIEKGNPNLDLVDIGGQSPLFLAIYRQNYDLANKIIKRNTACINFVTFEQEFTALIYSVHIGADDLVVKLIENGAKIDHREYRDNTAPILAIKENNVHLAKIMLIAHGDKSVFIKSGKLVSTPEMDSFILSYEQDPVATIMQSPASPIIKAMGLKKVYEQSRVDSKFISQQIDSILSTKVSFNEREGVTKIRELILESEERKGLAREEESSRSFSKRIEEERRVQRGEVELMHREDRKFTDMASKVSGLRAPKTSF